MNSLIESLNQWGEHFLSFAWPMFWQSSLLIAVLFSLDLLFRRQLRASIRYALWLVVLVKLCLPPTLAIPTSPAWWLHRTPPPAIAKPLPHFTVTYDSSPLPEMPPASLPTYVPPAPVMSLTAWLLAVSIAVSLVLFFWLLVRWWQVARMVRQATAVGQFSEQLADALQLVGAPGTVPARSQNGPQRAETVLGVPNAWRTSVRLKIVADQISPAVCGLFRPTILIPQSLAEHFSTEQLRAVLLHELIHLRRRDVWVNCLQALLQIFYWWHPLVWFANARIRRVREEAVDDAVMLALRDGAECYAPTLLEVAKLALNRPLASLGLVGIMESRHALRQRIERLVDFRAPRHAGLTLVSLLGILAFTAVAVPMGEGPAEESKSSGSLGEPEVTTTSGHTVNHVENVTGYVGLPAKDSLKTNPPQVLITGWIYQMSASEAEKIITGLKFNQAVSGGDPWWTASPEQFRELMRRMESTGLEAIIRPRILGNDGQAAMVYLGNGTSFSRFDCTPFVVGRQIDLALHGQVVNTKKTGMITNQFNARTSAENFGGFVMRVENMDGFVESNVVMLASVEIVTNSARFQQRLNSVINRTNSALTYTGPGRQAILDKLKRIRFGNVVFDDVPLSEVLRQLSEKSRLADPERKGVNFMINPNRDQSGPGSSSPTNSVSGGAAALDVGKFVVKLNLVDARLEEVLAAILRVAQNPNPNDQRIIQYSIKDYGIVFQPKPAELPQLFTREFRVDTNVFIKNLGVEGNRSKVYSTTSGERMIMTTSLASEVSSRARNAFTNAGVNLDEPIGKAVFYNDRSGKLLVRATEKDLDVIEKLIHDLNTPSIIDPGPQIHIKARFLGVPRGAVAGFNQLLGQQVPIKPVPTTSVVADLVNGSPVVRPDASGAVPVKPVNAAQLVGILTRTNFISMLRALEAQADVENLGEPEVTTLSGRQTQIRMTQVLELVTNLVYQEDATNGPIVPQMGKVETGPILDVVPYVLSDGYTINLALIPSLTKFLGYHKSTNTTTGHNRAGDEFNMPTVSPRFAIRQAVATVNLWDDQTAVISGIPETINVNGSAITGKPKSTDKELLVFITATLIDPAGNRVHSDRDLPFAQKGVPEQPKQK